MNHYLEYAGYSACKVHMVRIQKKIYTEDDRILTRKEYARLLQSCSDPRTQLIMETLCSTGIRVSELHYITVENYRKKMIKVYNKGKERVVFLPDRLIAHLRRYIKRGRSPVGDLHQQDRKALGSHRDLADDETIVRKGRSRPEKVEMKK
ncbi:MAG: tyrosine-type recombinase/integrase [Merdibacter sp.]